jgi:hypothetical protein
MIAARSQLQTLADPCDGIRLRSDIVLRDQESAARDVGTKKAHEEIRRQLDLI